MKKILTVMLCLILCFTFLPKQTFAADSYTVTVSANGADYGYEYNRVVYKSGESFTVEAGTTVSGFVNFPSGAGLAVSACSLSDGTPVSENGSIGRVFTMPAHDVTLNITIGEDPTLNGSVSVAPIEKLVGTTITATVTGANTTNLVYKWYKGSLLVGEGTTFTPTETGSYSIAVTSPDKTGTLRTSFSVVSNEEYTVTFVIPKGVTVAASGVSGEFSNGDSIKVKVGTYIIFYAHMPAGATLDSMKTEDNEYLEDGGTIARRMTMPAKDVTVIVSVNGLPEEPDHTHDFSGDWLKDSENHWKKCKECDEIDQLHTHASSAYATETEPEVCSVCDYVMAPALGHQHKNHLTYVEKKDSTCQVNGIDAHYECSCGELFLDADAATSAGSIDELSLPLAAHKYGPSTVATEPTCTEGGETEHECTVCGRVDREPTPAAGHKYGAEYVDEAATCTSEGRKAQACSACGDIKITETIPKTAHSFGVPYTSVEPTCTQEGTSVHECAYCGTTEYADTLLPTGHTPKADLTSDADNHYTVCEICNETLSSETHFDNDDDGKCDACDYELPGNPGTDPEDPTNPDNPGTDPENPDNPDNPGTDPEDPENPDNPGTDPEDPTNPDNPGTDPENPDNPGNDPVNPNPGTPNTGDDNSLVIWISAMALSAAALLALLLKRRSEK